MDLTAAEIAELPNILALARMNIGAQLANGVKDEGGRAVALLATIAAIEEKLLILGPSVETATKPAKKRNGKAAHAGA